MRRRPTILIPRRVRRLAVAFVVALAAAGAPAVAMAAPGDPSPTADRISGLYDAIFWAAIAVLAAGQALIIFTTLRPRPAGEPEGEEPLPGSRYELAWTLAPAALVVALAMLAYRAFH